MSDPKAFEIEVNGRFLDYRVGNALDLDAIRDYFSEDYEVRRIWNGGRHVLGILARDDKEYFLKFATSEGISALSVNEYKWNELFNRAVPRDTSDLWVHENVSDGWYTDVLYYFITDLFSGHKLADIEAAASDVSDLSARLNDVIRLSEVVQDVPVIVSEAASDHRDIFVSKARAWFNAVPESVRSQYELHTLLERAEAGAGTLVSRPRHGDFTPWHIMKLDNGKLGLIDGEHFLPNGVANYDIAYFIQRVYSILAKPETAVRYFDALMEKRYDRAALCTVLAARAIGGYLDASLTDQTDFGVSREFHRWVLSLG